MEIVVRAAVVFLFLLVVLRAMGKKELSELTALDLVLLVTIGDVVQQGVTQEDMSLTGAMLAAGTLVVLVVCLSYVTYRWKEARSIFQGAPVLVVADGEFLDDALRSERLTTEEILEAARIEGIADIGDIRYAVLETSGKMSFIRG